MYTRAQRTSLPSAASLSGKLNRLPHPQLPRCSATTRRTSPRSGARRTNKQQAHHHVAAAPLGLHPSARDNGIVVAEPNVAVSFFLSRATSTPCAPILLPKTQRTARRLGERLEIPLLVPWLIHPTAAVQRQGRLPFPSALNKTSILYPSSGTTGLHPYQPHACPRQAKVWAAARPSGPSLVEASF